MRANGCDYWLQPINDEFQGEYVPAYAERLPWLSGFYGSAGTGIVAAPEDKRCALLVDGRYIIQATADADNSLWDVANSSDVSIAEWLITQDTPDKVIACDAWLHTHAAIRRMALLLEGSGHIFKPECRNLVDDVWNDRPLPPAGDVMLYPESLAGQSAQEKILAVSHHLDALQLDAYIVTQPDAIAWLLNIRGADIPYNPLLLCYAVVLRDGRVYLITHQREFSPDIHRYFEANNIIHGTFDVWFRRDNLLYPECSGMRMGADPALSAHALWIWAGAHGITLTSVDDPILRLKAAKYPAEQEAMRYAHRVDAVSFTHFLAEIIPTLTRGMTELDVVSALEAARSEDNAYRGASFATIAGSGPNGAIVHYRATEQTNRTMMPGEVLLLDSGGQYLEGTTDITRMLPIGVVSSEIKDRYTRVLKGHIALAMARFPYGTSGRQLDTLARQFLWEIGCDYDHGTGHGVGTYLCVHEGPQRISKKGSDVPLEPGMVISNEPGYYKAGAYGIRIENLVMVVDAEPHGTLAFETITLVPIDTSLIERSLMNDAEIAWLDAYHARVLQVVGPHIRNAHALEWLGMACAPLR